MSAFEQNSYVPRIHSLVYAISVLFYPLIYPPTPFTWSLTFGTRPLQKENRPNQGSPVPSNGLPRLLLQHRAQGELALKRGVGSCLFNEMQCNAPQGTGSAVCSAQGACMFSCVRVCVRACVRVCMRASVRASVHACVRAYLHVPSVT